MRDTRALPVREGPFLHLQSRPVMARGGALDVFSLFRFQAAQIFVVSMLFSGMGVALCVQIFYQILKFRAVPQKQGLFVCAY